MPISESDYPKLFGPNKCACCGENNAAFLLLSVENDGTTDPSTVLCANCQLGLRRYGECPHKTIRRFEQARINEAANIIEPIKPDPVSKRPVPVVMPQRPRKPAMYRYTGPSRKRKYSGD